MKMIFKLVMLVLIGVSFNIYSYDSIPPAYHQASKVSGIAPQIIYAIALTESGKSIDGNYRPWPWTLTVDSKSIYFDDQQAMKEELQRVLSNEPKQLGIGLMQIEWRYHKNRFASIEEATNPYSNLQVGVEILSEYLKEQPNLWMAIGRYHSGTLSLATQYQARVGQQLVNYVLGN